MIPFIDFFPPFDLTDAYRPKPLETLGVLAGPAASDFYAYDWPRFRKVVGFKIHPVFTEIDHLGIMDITTRIRVETVPANRGFFIHPLAGAFVNFCIA